jgi:hypothetical protein
MWSRRFLWTGIATGIPAAALALTFLWLLLLGVQSIKSLEGLHRFAVFGIPGVLAYPICWYRLIFKSRSYTSRDTMMLIAFSFGACCLFDVAILGAGQVAAISGDFISKGPLGWALLLLVLLLLPIGLAILAVTVAAFLVVPFVATAGPIAFLHRALLLKWFGSRNGTDAHTGPIARGSVIA